jgi:hypothetical protein
LGNNPTIPQKTSAKGWKWERNCASKEENLQSCLQAVSSLFPMPLSLFVNSDFNLSESRSKDLKMSHKFRFWMAHLCAENFSAVQEHKLQNCPLFAVRHFLSFWQ